MAAVTGVPVWRRFGVRVILFNAILLLSVVLPWFVIDRADYKHLVDRIDAQRALFDYARGRARLSTRDDAGSAVSAAPRILARQRIFVIGLDNRIFYDSGTMAPPGRTSGGLGLVLPDPYIDPSASAAIDPLVLAEWVIGLDLPGRLDRSAAYLLTATVGYAEGADRVVLTAAREVSANGEPFVLAMTQSVVDILINGRAVKERLLLLFAAVAVLALVLTVTLTLTVTSPLRRLYRYSLEILSGRPSAPPFRGARSGEIAAVCAAVSELVDRQRRDAERFRNFSADVVHELRTPLAAIRSAIELFGEEADPAERARLVERVNRRIAHMESVMDEIRMIGRIESAGIDEMCADPASVVREAIREAGDAAALAGTAGTTGITDTVGTAGTADTAGTGDTTGTTGIAGRPSALVNLDIDPGLANLRLPIGCDTLRRAVVNLVENAVSFSPEPGSVDVDVGLTDESSAAGCAAKRALRIRVRDRGPGIPDTVFDRITERFYTYRPAECGGVHSGIGLAIVDAVARASGGRLTYRNRDGGGAEFTCVIPVLPDGRCLRATRESRIP